MKKLIAMFLVIAIGVWTFGPLFAVADDTITTKLTRVDSGTSGNNPIVKAKWEMYTPDSHQCGDDHQQLCGDGVDEQTKAGAQFAAPGIWGEKMEYTVCAIVTDPNGVADIKGVYADIFYPDDVAFHPMDSDHSDELNGGTDNNPDYGLSGCGKFIEENTLLPLSKAEGYELFCDIIKNNNNSLPTFFTHNGTTYDYGEICGETGELMKETAKVYCDDKSLTWEDPAGNYTVEVFALDNSGNFSYSDTDPVDYNVFEYLPFIGYEVDFSEVNYGNVALDSHKIISGDKTWEPTNSDKPTVRNIGNERIYMNISQDDMGLGQTSGDWNVQFDARVGNNESDWRTYLPLEDAQLEDILDLSETEEMDFSILVTKFPSTQENYTGGMDLWATEANFRECWN